MADRLDSATIIISIFYLLVALLISTMETYEFTEDYEYNYGDANIDVGNENVDDINISNIVIIRHWVVIFFKNLFLYFSIPDAPAWVITILNLPRVTIIMWFIRLLRGG